MSIRRYSRLVDYILNILDLLICDNGVVR